MFSDKELLLDGWKKAFTLIKSHKNDIIVGDIIKHDGKILTVCRKDITHCHLLGVCLFGDSYKLGNAPVYKYIYNNPVKGN